ncbi:MAG: UDP-N-acetylglucosamine 2-epimerase (non-hydrolyzing), partial [Candidatus Paceibacterota bacterium]
MYDEAITFIIGTRPNFMKAYPVYLALKDNFKVNIIHTGQHHDDKMSQSILQQLGFPIPDILFKLNSKTKSGILDEKLYINNREYLSDISKVIDDLCILDGSQLGQFGEIRDKILVELKKIRPRLVMVFGDVTSTLAGAIASYKENIKIAHVESGLRSFDLSMPEEVNRIVTDHITSYYFVTETSGIENLERENLGNEQNRFLIGNTMIDSLFMFKENIEKISYNEKLGLQKGVYVLITLHRPGNVDNLEKLEEITKQIIDLSKKYLIVFPIHPRTKNHFEKLNITLNENIKLLNPLPYMEFVSLTRNAKFVITDSGGIQEETSAMGVPCFTLRPNTERPSTLIKNGGTNELINSIEDIKKIEVFESLLNTYKPINYKINIILKTILQRNLSS